MATLSPRRLGVPAVTVLVWALAAASAVYWGLRIRGEASGGQASAPVAAPGETQPDPQAVARVLGASGVTAAPASVASRFALQGVVASPAGGGSALISVDGQPARPYLVGAAVSEGWVLRSVAGRHAVLAAADGGAALTLELPPLKP